MSKRVRISLCIITWLALSPVVLAPAPTACADGCIARADSDTASHPLGAMLDDSEISVGIRCSKAGFNPAATATYPWCIGHPADC